MICFYSVAHRENHRGKAVELYDLMVQHIFLKDVVCSSETTPAADCVGQILAVLSPRDREVEGWRARFGS